MEEVAKSVKLYLMFVIATCATVLAFLISPTSTVSHLKDAKQELTHLKKALSLGQNYEEYVRKKLSEQRFRNLQDAIDVAVPMDEIVRKAPLSEILGSQCGGCVAPPASNSPLPPQEAPREAPRPDTTTEGTKPPTLAISEGMPKPALGVAAKKELEVFELQDDKSWKSSKHQAQNAAAKYATVDSNKSDEWGKALPIVPNALTSFATVADCRQFLSSEKNSVDYIEEIQIFMPYSIDLAESFRLILSLAPEGKLESWKLIPQAKPAKTNAQPASAPVTVVARLLCVLKENDKQRTLCASLRGEWKCGSCNSVPVMSFMDWIESNHPDVVKELCDSPKNQHSQWLPDSHKVWSDVSSKEIDEAILQMDTRIDKETERISLFGLSASAASASLAFPLAMIIAFFINLIQINHLKNNLPKGTDELLAIKNQWVGFYPSLMPCVVHWGLLVVFPCLIFAWLCIVSRAYLLQIPINTSLGVILLVMAVLNANELESIRKSLNPAACNDEPRSRSMVEKHDRID